MDCSSSFLRICLKKVGSTVLPFKYLSLHFRHLYRQPGKRTVQKDKREMVLMGWASARGSGESRQEGKFQLWQWKDSEKHRKKQDQWGHCLFEPVSLAGYHAVTHHYNNLSGMQAKYLIIKKDEWFLWCWALQNQHVTLQSPNAEFILTAPL